MGDNPLIATPPFDPDRMSAPSNNGGIVNNGAVYGAVIPVSDGAFDGIAGGKVITQDASHEAAIKDYTDRMTDALVKSMKEYAGSVSGQSSGIDPSQMYADNEYGGVRNDGSPVANPSPAQGGNQPVVDDGSSPSYGQILGKAVTSAVQYGMDHPLTASLVVGAFDPVAAPLVPAAIAAYNLNAGTGTVGEVVQNLVGPVLNWARQK